jgi:hypothetical protein
LLAAGRVAGRLRASATIAGAIIISHQTGLSLRGTDPAENVPIFAGRVCFTDSSPTLVASWDDSHSGVSANPVQGLSFNRGYPLDAHFDPSPSAISKPTGGFQVARGKPFSVENPRRLKAAACVHITRASTEREKTGIGKVIPPGCNGA